MKTGMVLLLLLCSGSSVAGEWNPEKVQKYKECVPILKQVKWVKAMRAQNMETAGHKNLADIEKEWEEISWGNGCYVWQGEFDRRNP